MAIQSIATAVKLGARQKLACNIIGITPRSLQNWRITGLEDQRQIVKKAPVNKLSEREREHVLAVCNSEEFKDQSPKQIVPALADKGLYIASESSFYRILQDVGQLEHRGRSSAPGTLVKPDPYVANGPNQVWSWDITYLASTIKGATMLATMQKIGVVPSFSRPSVSNDNPFSEALFKTLKYVPVYPSKPFDNVDDARQWVAKFCKWYNNSHRHSGLKFVTPVQRHNGDDVRILEQRKIVYEQAKKMHPERWSGKTRNWNHEAIVKLNPVNEQASNGELIKAA